VSTYGNRVNDLSAVIKEPRRNVRYLIGHQGSKVTSKPKFLEGRDDIEFFSLDSVGVTQSRNYLLERANADICYFCDDDIQLVDNFDELLREVHLMDSSEIITLRVDDESGFPRKKAPSSSKRGWLNILAVGTIEISLKRMYLGDIRFCEYMGAGSNIPIGDEAVFLSEFLREGYSISYQNKCIASHPKESSGSSPTISSIYARGVTIRKVYGFIIGLFLVPCFILLRRNLISHPNIAVGMKAFVFGFLLIGLNKLKKRAQQK
jgi:glycosyltransferase involved in cell wall biosynthesis